MSIHPVSSPVPPGTLASGLRSPTRPSAAKRAGYVPPSEFASHEPLLRPPRSLLWRLFAANAVLLIVATLVLLVGPVTVSYPPTNHQVVMVCLGLLVALATDLILLRRTLAPLRRLTAVMRSVDPLAPGQRLGVRRGDREVAALTQAFNQMLDRLETERRESARREFAAEELERRRIARELHDEIGQVLTGLVLQTESLTRRAPGQFGAELGEMRELARKGAEDARHMARRLRPEALDELGLQSALLALSSAFMEYSGVDVEREFGRGVPPLHPEVELVIYRVAQESLTNVARHARAAKAELRLDVTADEVVLWVRDNGRGLPEDFDQASNGIRGMRERAVLIGARLVVESARAGGTEIRLHVPISQGQ